MQPNMIAQMIAGFIPPPRSRHQLARFDGSLAWRGEGEHPDYGPQQREARKNVPTT